MSQTGRRDAYNQLLRMTRRLDSSLMALCEAVIPQLPSIEDPARSAIANALTEFAVTIRNELERNGDFRRLAETLEYQAKELLDVKERLDKVRHELSGIYRGVSETSGMRTKLVVLDEHLAAIESQIKLLGPPSEAEMSSNGVVNDRSERDEEHD